MPRVSKKQAAENHAAVIDAAARLFKARGINGVSVPELMAEAGLTHGAFYGHFNSKEDLAAAACEHAFEKMRTQHAESRERNQNDPHKAWAEFLGRYTGRAHRDQPGLGCPVAALVEDAARDDSKGPVRKAFAGGLESMIERVEDMRDGLGKNGHREEALADVAMLVGAVVLARATKGQPISDEILQAARASLASE